MFDKAGHEALMEMIADLGPPTPLGPPGDVYAGIPGMRPREFSIFAKPAKADPSEKTGHRHIKSDETSMSIFR